MKQYAVEVKCKGGVWNKVGYEEIFNDLQNAIRFMNLRKGINPKCTYRIVSREVGEWNEISGV